MVAIEDVKRPSGISLTVMSNDDNDGYIRGIDVISMVIGNN